MLSAMLRRLLLVSLLALHLPLQAQPPVLLVYGDSLSAGYGLATGSSWIDLLISRLQRSGHDYRVVNLSLSGETSAGGRARIQPVLTLHRPAVMVLELGGNDGLRALPVATVKYNLGEIIGAAQARRTRVLLVGMRIPPNYGPRYSQAFEQMYLDLAREYRVPLLPFLLDRVATRNELMQADGLHPNAAAQPLILETLWPLLQPLL